MIKDDWTTTIHAALSGKQSAWNKLYYFLAPIIRRTIKKKLYSIHPYDVDDITQDIISKIFLKLNTFIEGRNLEAWAKQITINHCIDIGRKGKLDIKNTDFLLEFGYENPEFSERTPIRSTPDILLIMEKELEEKHRNHLVEKYIHGLRQKELSAKYNKPLGSISSIHAKAIMALRNMVDALHLERSDFF